MKLTSLTITATLLSLLAATGTLARPVRFHAVHVPRAVDISDADFERLTPQFGVTRGIPFGDGPAPCRGVRNATGQIVAIPCECPPDRAAFLELVKANVKAGFVLKNPDVKDLKFPLDDSQQSKLDRLHVATVSLQSITGPGVGCPNAGTTWGPLEAAIRAGTDVTDGTGTAAVPATFTGTLVPAPTDIPPATTTDAPAPTDPAAPLPVDGSPAQSTETPSVTTAPSSTETNAPSTNDNPSDSYTPDEPSSTTTNAPIPTDTGAPLSSVPGTTDEAPATSTDTPPETGINPPSSTEPVPPATSGAPSTTDEPAAGPTSTPPPPPPSSGGGASGTIDTNLSDADIARLAPSLGWRANINPDGTGNCDGAVASTNKDEQGNILPILVPCACPPGKDAFLQALTANIRAGRVVNNPGIPAAFTFPTGDSADDQLARITAASATLQNLHGEGQGCPMASTTLIAQAAAIRAGKPLPPDQS